MDHNNQTDRIFDLSKEASIVANIVVGDLMDVGLIKKGTDNAAVEIAATQFLAFRTSRSSSGSEDVIKAESSSLAKIIINEFIAAGIVNQADESRTFEIAEEEILVRRSMESL